MDDRHQQLQVPETPRPGTTFTSCSISRSWLYNCRRGWGSLTCHLKNGALFQIVDRECWRKRSTSTVSASCCYSRVPAGYLEATRTLNKLTVFRVSPLWRRRVEAGGSNVPSFNATAQFNATITRLPASQSLIDNQAILYLITRG